MNIETDAPPRSTDKIPLISVRDLRGDDQDRKLEIAEEIGQAARNFGFFRICDHGIDLDLIETTYEAGRRFFAQRDAQKLDYYIGKSSNHRGYVPFTEKGDYADEVNRSYEAFDLGWIYRRMTQITLPVTVCSVRMPGPIYLAFEKQFRNITLKFRLWAGSFVAA